MKHLIKITITSFLTIIMLWSCDKASSDFTGDYTIDSGNLIINNIPVMAADYPDATIKIEPITRDDANYNVTLLNILKGASSIVFKCNLTGDTDNGIITSVEPTTKNGYVSSITGVISDRKVSLNITFTIDDDIVNKWMIGAKELFSGTTYVSNIPNAGLIIEKLPNDKLIFDGPSDLPIEYSKDQLNTFIDKISLSLTNSYLTTSYIKYLEFTSDGYLNYGLSDISKNLIKSAIEDNKDLIPEEYKSLISDDLINLLIGESSDLLGYYKADPIYNAYVSNVIYTIFKLAIDNQENVPDFIKNLVSEKTDLPIPVTTYNGMLIFKVDQTILNPLVELGCQKFINTSYKDAKDSDLFKTINSIIQSLMGTSVDFSETVFNIYKLMADQLQTQLTSDESAYYFQVIMVPYKEGLRPWENN
ncbi:MAG: hypothetical protein WC140_03660 [Bacteroidales bacterium]